MPKNQNVDKYGLTEEEPKQIEEMVDRATAGWSLSDFLKHVKFYPDYVAPDPSRVCPRCKSYRLDNNDKFCGKCGNRLSN